MPVIGEQKDRVADLLEELIEKLDERIEQGPPTVNVAPAQVKVEPPAVHVAPAAVNMPAAPRPSGWFFDIVRNSEGRIATITATPKF